MFDATVTDEHRWLAQLAGDWIIDDPDGTMEHPSPPWREHVDMVGEFWIAGVSTGEMPGGGAAETRITLGFDPARGRFVGSFIGSMMTYLWIYDGELDAGGTTLTLNADGPDLTDPSRMRHYRDVITIVSADERRFEGFFEADDGSWQRMMSLRYRRA
ncbi:DUF1579 domain-containing protein [Methylobrevis albus]|uniref:DUF1579 domain-containing protein n=1 Tax=Methylobrevis albus TaxID=2793297 RepID=A0A931I5B2_9HYPH|nr:DUF1579 domain-containing protein [Methylobrevis albus]MBH0239553.1 DUF1579 domain-containing protein [Methylobrevis albus]